MEQAIANKIDELERSYRMPDAEKLKAYLAARPGLVDILVEARPHIELQFGRDAVVQLRFPRDYEGDYGGALLAMVQSPLDADAALDGFDRFWDEWWGKASGRRESFPLYM
jgi:hypothetical protein